MEESGMSARVCACGDHAWVELTRGYVVIVDSYTAPLVDMWKWHSHFSAARSSHPARVWAARSVHYWLGADRKCHTVSLQSLLLPLPPGLVVDFADGNTLNCRRRNLRAATTSENHSHRKQRVNGATSQYRGVTWYSKKWTANVTHRGKRYYLGLFDTEETAARAYDAKARELFGSFAYQNFQDGEVGA